MYTQAMDDSLPPFGDPYERIAELYDLEHAAFRADIDLLLSFADIVGDPILEMGCGSGRILIPLAAAGFDVTGIDRSPTMLARADVAVRGAGVSDRVTLSAIDMVNADQAPGGPFGLVIFSLNALMHLTTPGLQLAALSAAFAALDPKGQLIIDTLDPSPSHLTQLESGKTLEGSWDRPDGSTVDKWSHRHIHPATQRIDTILWYDQSLPDGRLTRTRTRFPLRYVHASELELMLRLAGFSETRFYGNYDLEPYEDDAERLFVTSEVTPSKRRPRLK